MKKTIKIMLVLLIIASCFTLVGCKKKHKHSYEETVINPTCLNGGYTTYTCECGDKYDDNHVDALGHDTVTYNYKAATCTQDGHEAYEVCKRCDYTTYVKIESKGHQYISNEVDPTCTEDGYTEYTCSCGDSYKDNVTSKLSHQQVEIPGVEATCKNTGLTTGYYCSVCEEVLVEQVVIDKKDHTVVVDAAVSATCENEGLTEGSHCSECGEVFVSQEVIPASHNFVNNTCTKCQGTYLTFTLNNDGVSYSVSKGSAKVSEIVIPATYEGKPVTTIPTDAFFNSKSLKKITIGANISSIGEHIFSKCSSLVEIVVDASNTTYDSRENCNGIVKKSTNSLFTGCKATVVPSTVVSIADMAFAYNAIESIHIPSNIESIGVKAFYYCENLKTVTMDPGVRIIYYSAFEECHMLTSINLPNTLNTIGNSAFRFCIELTEITIPDSVNSLGVGALSYCDKLQKVKLSNNLTEIAEQMFFMTFALTEVEIPNGVLTIGECAFMYCSKLTGITIPNSVVEVKASAFYGCTKLSAVTFGNNISIIGNEAFYGCDSLTTVYYSLTQDRWAMVNIGSGNNKLTNATFVYNN